MVLIAGCTGGDDSQAQEDSELGGDHLLPTWESEVDDRGGAPADDPAELADGAPPQEATLPGTEEESADEPGAPAPPADGEAPPAQAPAAPVTASITDPEGDVTASALERPPAWVDLLGATLTRSAEEWELRIRVAGGQAPDSTGSDQHTMNVAFFADLDGDGTVDAQIWANLADHGWGTGWFPPEPPNRFGDESEVVVTTEGDEVVLRFPASHMPVERLRWSLASEWGRYETLGTDLAARDRVPDTGPERFP